MTTTYDPDDPAYLDEADARNELTRTFAVCADCRACVDRCGVFPTLFDLLDATGANDPGLLTPAEQDTVVDECFHCDRCVDACPFSPHLGSERSDDARSVSDASHAGGPNPAPIHVPRLVLRTLAMRDATGRRSVVQRATDGARVRAAGLRLMSSGTGATPSPSRWRDVASALGERLGFDRASMRVAAPSRGERFSSWFDAHVPRLGRHRRGSVGVYPTCLVEYQADQLGRDLVGVFEHSGIECHRSAAGCCGSPWLHSGDLATFRTMANHVVTTLAAEIRSRDLDAIVVPEPTCRAVMTDHYPVHAEAGRRTDAEFVARHLVDPSAHLTEALADAEPTVDVGAEPMPTIVYHLACHARSDAVTSPGLALVRAATAGTSTDVIVVDRCAGIGGRWDRTGSAPALEDAIASSVAAGDAVLVGECGLANSLVARASGAEVVHPLSVVAAVWGVDDAAERDGS